MGPGHAPLPPILAEFEWVYDGLAERGWAPSEVDGWDIPRCARFLGLGPEGDETRYRQVIRGSRAVALASDSDSTESGAAFQSDGTALQQRLALYDEAEAEGRPVSGAVRPVRPPNDGRLPLT